MCGLNIGGAILWEFASLVWPVLAVWLLIGVLLLAAVHRFL